MGQKLTKAQVELLQLLSGGARTDISDERDVAPLVADGLVLKFYEATGGVDLDPVWAITDAGRLALSGEKK